MKACVHILLFLLLGSTCLKAESYAIPFRLIQNLIVIEATIDDNTGLFILDTGTDAIFVDKTSCLIQSNQQEFATAQGNLLSQSFIIKHFSLGKLSRRNLEAFNARMDNIESFLSLDIAGIVGANVFLPHSILFDFNHSLLYVVDKNFDLSNYSFTNQIDFSMQLGVPTVSVLIENFEYTFILDSGASAHMVDSQVINRHPVIFRPTEQQVQIETLGGDKTQNYSRYQLDNMRIGQQHWSDISCVRHDFSDLNLDSGSIISGLLSLSNLNASAVLFDFKKHKVFF